MLKGKHSSFDTFSEGNVRKRFYSQYVGHFQHNLEMANRMVVMAKKKGCAASSRVGVGDEDGGGAGGESYSDSWDKNGWVFGGEFGALDAELMEKGREKTG